MITINLDQPWTYRTPDKTIVYPAGKHRVFKYIAEKAEADGVISKGTADGETDGAAETGSQGAADAGEG